MKSGKLPANKNKKKDKKNNFNLNNTSKHWQKKNS